MTFGQAMVQARLKLDMSQRELEFHSGIRHSTLAAYELEKGFPQLDNAIKIARALNMRISLSDLDPVLLPREKVVTFNQLKRISDLKTELEIETSKLPMSYFDPPCRSQQMLLPTGINQPNERG